MMASAASVGRASGRATNRKMRHSLTPSTRAASNSSCGIIEKLWRMNSTPSELNSGGTISATQVLASLKSRATMMNCGMTTTK